MLNFDYKPSIISFVYRRTIFMARKKVRIDADTCIGCGSCVGNYPDDFMMNDSGVAEVIAGEAEEESKDVCPVGAIVVED